MAYMNQERKNELSPKIKAVLKKYNVKASIAVERHSTLVVTISESGFNEIDGHVSVNEYHIDKHYSGTIAEFLQELRAAMMNGNHDRSDIQSDYFDVGWYINIQFGKWNKPHRCSLQTAN